MLVADNSKPCPNSIPKITWQKKNSIRHYTTPLSLKLFFPSTSDLISKTVHFLKL